VCVCTEGRQGPPTREHQGRTSWYSFPFVRARHAAGSAQSDPLPPPSRRARPARYQACVASNLRGEARRARWGGRWEWGICSGACGGRGMGSMVRAEAWRPRLGGSICIAWPSADGTSAPKLARAWGEEPPSSIRSAAEPTSVAPFLRAAEAAAVRSLRLALLPPFGGISLDSVPCRHTIKEAVSQRHACTRAFATVLPNLPGLSRGGAREMWGARGRRCLGRLTRRSCARGRAVTRRGDQPKVTASVGGGRGRRPQVACAGRAGNAGRPFSVAAFGRTDGRTQGGAAARVQIGRLGLKA